MEAMTTLPDFQVPKIAGDDADDNKGTFTIEPLDKGFGYTFGNSLRRVLLSSLGGAAITSVRIEGVAHEFSTIPGLKEDVTDLVLNLKDVVVRMHTDADEVETPLVATGPGEVKAKDIDLPAGVEILNPEAPIATLEKKTKLEMYLTIGRGRGYSPADENKSDADRRRPDRLDLLADPPHFLLGRLRPCRAADRLRQAHDRGRDRRLHRAGRGAARGGRDPDQEPGDLHDRRPRR
jgi:DNA-directed RNA polymerase subunit alpha